MTETMLGASSTGPNGNGPVRPAVPQQRAAATSGRLDRPAPPAAGPARSLRRVIGIREEILDWAAEERPRYSRLGLIVVNTAIMAAVSLFVALQRVIEVPWPAVLPLALFWGFLVLAIDSWMVSSTHGALGVGRLLMFAPRLLLAVLIGTVIAEPLVLWIFHPAIHANVAQSRQDEIEKYAGQWTACNPTTGSAVKRPECANFQLGLADPQATRVKLASLTADRTAQDREIGTLAAQLSAKQALAQAECAGDKVPGTTGQRGRGFQCDSDWKVADDFESQVDLPARRTRLKDLDKEINAVRTTLANAERTYSQSVERGIAAKVAEFRASYRQVDIIDEARGLERLSHESIFVLAAQWLVRILLIVVDGLPVLAKMLGGTTAYDHLVNKQLQAGQRFYGRDLKLAEHTHETATTAGIEKLDMDSRTVQARYDEDLEAEIDRRARRYAEMDAGD